MRIVAGAWRGRLLIAPEGRSTRPTSDRAREGLFSMLASRIGSFEGLLVADLFAGSGALGLEALSRGAAHCLFVEKERGAVAAIQRNIAVLGAAVRTEVRSQRVEFASLPDDPRDLILIDPPYESELSDLAVSHVSTEGWLAPGGWIAVETAGRPPALPGSLKLEAGRRFGKAHVFLLRRSI